MQLPILYFSRILLKRKRLHSALENIVRASVKNPHAKEIEAIEAIFTKRSFKKGESFKSCDSVSKELAFILSGSARAYFVNDKGDEVTTSLIQHNHFFADFISVRTNQSNRIELAFLEKTEALITSIDSHKNLLEVNLAYNILIREHLATEALKSINRQLLFLNGTAKERYDYILQNNPQLIKKFPLKYIASMIGVTPTQLSRIRNK